MLLSGLHIETGLTASRIHLAIFTLYLAMKENAFEYVNNNYYVFKTDNVWQGCQLYGSRLAQRLYDAYFTRFRDEKYTDSIIVNTYMKWEDVVRWENTSLKREVMIIRNSKLRKPKSCSTFLKRTFPG